VKLYGSESYNKSTVGLLYFARDSWEYCGVSNIDPNDKSESVGLAAGDF
jgi:hypothetical protein